MYNFLIKKINLERILLTSKYNITVSQLSYYD